MSGSSPEGWGIEPLGPRHDRESFECGEPALDEFLKKYARQNENRGISRTYVFVRGPDPRILGYYVLRTGDVDMEDLPPEETHRLPRYPVPIAHLARLAVDRTVQGQGIGEILLASALKKALAAADIMGIYAVEVMAKSAEAKRFYERHLFRAFPDNPLRLYLPIATVRGLVK